MAETVKHPLVFLLNEFSCLLRTKDVTMHDTNLGAAMGSKFWSLQKLFSTYSIHILKAHVPVLTALIIMNTRSYCSQEMCRLTNFKTSVRICQQCFQLNSFPQGYPGLLKRSKPEESVLWVPRNVAE